MGPFLIRALFLVLAVLAASAVWIWAGRWLTAGLDRLFTVTVATLPTGYFELAPDSFVIGPLPWSSGAYGGLMTDDSRLAMDSRKHMTLQSGNRTFSFGPVYTYCDAGRDSYFRFNADPGDEISFTKSRSWLAWPTPFRINFMGAELSSWGRYAYYRLLWKKRSGAAIEMTWRDEQGFYAKSGWCDENLQNAPVIRITPSPYEKVVEQYLFDKKGWSRDEYALESRGTSDDGQCDVTAAIYLKDLSAPHPGAGQSVNVYVDLKSRQVIREIGGQ